MQSSLVLGIDNSLDFLNLALGTYTAPAPGSPIDRMESGAQAGGCTVAEQEPAPTERVALARIIEERHAKIERLSSEVLPVKVSQLLTDHGYSPSDLSLLLVTLGPGSFTGIRVALAFSKGLSKALGIPLIGVPTPDVLAFPLAFLEDYYLCSLVDAKKGEVFFALYRAAEGRIRCVDGYRALKPDEVGEKILAPCLCFGTGVRLCEAVLNELDGVRSLKTGFHRVAGEALLRTGLAGYGAAEGRPVLPIYGRKSEAEIKFDVTLP